MGGSIRGRARTTVVVWAAPFLVGFGSALSLRAQTAPETVIRVDAPLVVLNASVRDGKGRIVPGLKQRNFRVSEDGTPQEVRGSRVDDLAVAVGLVIDNSGSMHERLDEVLQAAVTFARFSNPDDRLFVVNFSDSAVFALPDTMLFTGSAAALEGAVRNPTAPGRTALYDAVRAALAHLGASSAERKALLVISDGGDNASKSTLDRLFEDVWRSNAAIYTLSLFDEDDRERNSRILRQMAKISGGESFFPASAASAVKACERIAKDIRAQYALSYSPTNEKFDGKRRSISVTAFGEHGEKLKVRARTGYIASPSGGR